MNGERQILVIAPNWLGDAVMALPALADVRRHFSQARLTIAARGSVAPLYSMVASVDEVITLQWPGGARRQAVMNADVERLRAADATVAILFPNSWASAWLVKRAGIAERWGYASDWRARLLTRTVRRPRRSVHQAEYYRTLVRELGIPNGSLDPVIDVATAALDDARALLASRGWNGADPLIAIAAGAAYGTAKRWLPRHFVRLIQSVARERHVRCVLVGSRADAETSSWIVQSLDADARRAVVDLTGATSLEMLAAILRCSTVCVSNDSGAMHLAGAVGVPLAALFGPTREYETSPLTRPGIPRELLINPVWCRPCMLRECPIDHRCMKGLLPERVSSAVERLMNAGAA